MEAKERIAQGGSVTFIEPEVWRRYYDDHMKFVYVDKNATDSSTQGQVVELLASMSGPVSWYLLALASAIPYATNSSYVK